MVKFFPLIFVLGAFSALSTSSVIGAVTDIHFLRVPDAGVQPQVVVDAQGTVHLVFLKGDPKACDVIYTERIRGGTNFAAGTCVNSTPGSAIAIGTVRGAQVALGRRGRVHVVWNGSEKASISPTGGAPMLYSRSNEKGTAFDSERNLMTSTTHLDGGSSVAADEQGRVYAVWHGHRQTGPQEEQDRGVFLAVSTDDGKTFTPERQVNPPETGACGCCGLKAFADKQSRLAILYRSARAEVNRDMVLLVSTNGGSSFQSQVVGPWRVSTCPMSTQALGNGPDNELLALWETQGRIYRAVIPSPQVMAAPGPSALQGSTGSCKHPAFALGYHGQTLLVAWTEGTGWEKGGDLAWEWLDLSSGQKETGRAPGVPVWSYAAVIPEPNGSFSLIY